MLSALSFLTVFGRGTTPNGRTMGWFPLAGAVIGATIGGIWWVASLGFAPLLAAALTVTAVAVITGMLHLDGLADSADGLLAHMDRETRLRVMKQPDIGSFGSVTLMLAWG